MYDIWFLGIGGVLMMGVWLYSRGKRQKLMKNGTTVLARVAGTVEGRNGGAYVLEFKAHGSTHRLNYPKPSKGNPLKVGSQVVLYYDPYKPERMFVEGDNSVLTAEKFYLLIGEVLLILMLVRVLQ